MPLDQDTVERIFIEAHGMPSGSERAAYLERACAGDAGLWARVEALLAAHEAAGGFLPLPEDASTADCPAPGAPPGSGKKIGNYKLLQLIGEGGFGQVFLAEQEQPVRRRVALKIIKLGMDTRQVIARFEAERQALALMDHPNIAKVFDAGATATGRPYFVMELVKGEPITDYCDRNGLNITQRLELFTQVCHAVGHAHQKGLIHRDIKPSNVLVGTEDGRPRVRVIDFGIAKATQARLTEKTLFTEMRQLVGTPEYMSPEQAEGSLDIDTRCDVYSLGVLLYELLAGSPPFDARELRSKAFAEMQRIIREVEPPRPSTRLSGSGHLAALAVRRGAVPPKKLAALVRGELDWIAMRCLEKDRSRRYQSAAALAADVAHYLTGAPVEACPPSAWYRSRKLARRYKGPLAAAALLVLTLLAGVAGTSWQAISATDQRNARQRALDAETAARKHAMAALRSLSDDVVERQMSRQPMLTDEDRAFLKRIIEHYEAIAALAGSSAESRDLRAEGHFRVGKLRQRLGELDDARLSFDRAKAIYSELAGEFPSVPDHRHSLAACHVNISLVLDAAGKWDQAKAECGRAIALLTQLVAASPDPERQSALGAAHNHLALYLVHLDDYDAAEAEQRNALNVRKRLFEAHPLVHTHRADLAASRLALGYLYQKRAAAPKAEDEYRLAIDLLNDLVADAPQVPDYALNLARTHNNLMTLLDGAGRGDEAEAEGRNALAVLNRLAGRFPTVPLYRQQLAMSANNLGNLLLGMTRLQDALSEFQAAQRICLGLSQGFPGVPEYRHQLAAIHCNIGNVLKDGREWARADAEYGRAVEICEALLKEAPGVAEYRKLLANTHHNRGLLLHVQQRQKDAEAEYEKALPLFQRLADDWPAVPEYRRALASVHTDLGIILEARGKLDDALTHQMTALDLRKRLAQDAPDVPVHAVELGGTYCNIGHLAESHGYWPKALGWYDLAVKTVTPVVEAKRKPGLFQAREYLRNCQRGRAQALMELQRFAEAAESWKVAAEMADPPWRQQFEAKRAECLAQAARQPALTQPATQPRDP